MRAALPCAFSGFTRPAPSVLVAFGGGGVVAGQLLLGDGPHRSRVRRPQGDLALVHEATADSGRSTKVVAPFGGREARLGTNPISIVVPSDLEAPFYLDMATSAVAAGKVALAAARGEFGSVDLLPVTPRPPHPCPCRS